MAKASRDAQLHGALALLVIHFLNALRGLQAVIITVAGGVGLLTQTVVLRLLMNYLGETRILILGELHRVTCLCAPA